MSRIYSCDLDGGARPWFVPSCTIGQVGRANREDPFFARVGGRTRQPISDPTGAEHVRRCVLHVLLPTVGFQIGRRVRSPNAEKWLFAKIRPNESFAEVACLACQSPARVATHRLGVYAVCVTSDPPAQQHRDKDKGGLPSPRVVPLNSR